MAISKKSLVAFFFSTILLMLVSFCSKVSASDSLSFTYGDFNQDEQDLIFQGDAKVASTKVLQLTKTNRKGVPKELTFGRALYSAPLRLWQKSTGRLSGFESTINFVLTSPTTIPGDGFAFFIAPTDTKIPSDTQGGYLGLFSPKTALNTSASQVVAVEFDTYFGNDNPWDPKYTHIGIDVNTIKSSAHVKWNRVEGAVGTARINYNAGTKKLTVVSSYPGSEVYTVSYVVDMCFQNGSELDSLVHLGDVLKLIAFKSGILVLHCNTPMMPTTKRRKTYTLKVLCDVIYDIYTINKDLHACVVYSPWFTYVIPISVFHLLILRKNLSFLCRFQIKFVVFNGKE